MPTIIYVRGEIGAVAAPPSRPPPPATRSARPVAVVRLGEQRVADLRATLAEMLERGLPDEPRQPKFGR